MDAGGLSSELSGLTLRGIDGGERMTILLAGEIDVANVGAVADTVDGWLAGRARDLVFECGELTFIDSRGLALLVRLRQSLAEHDRQLILRNVRREQRRLLEITKLDEVIPLEDD